MIQLYFLPESRVLQMPALHWQNLTQQASGLDQGLESSGSGTSYFVDHARRIAAGIQHLLSTKFFAEHLASSVHGCTAAELCAQEPAGIIANKSNEIFTIPWYLYQMVTQSILRTREGKQVFSNKNILFVTSLDLTECLEQIF